MEVYIAFIEYLVKNELSFYAKFLYEELIMLKPFPKEGSLYNQIQSISDMLGYSIKYKRNLFISPLPKKRQSCRNVNDVAPRK
jgi:uncharacterized protein YwqG